MDSNVRTYLLFLAVLLSGCGLATGPRFNGLQDPQSDEAILYVYRVGVSPETALEVPLCVYINGEKKDALKAGGYLMYRIAPQRTEVRLTDCNFLRVLGLGTETVLIDALPSIRYYLKNDRANWRSGRGWIEVSEEVALSDIQTLRRTN